MKKILLAALWLPLMALAQSYPSPTYQNVTVLGTLTGKVNSTGSTITNATITGGTISGLSSPLPVASGGTNSASASGTALDNIAGFAGTGFMSRTGAGAYSFTASTGSGSVVLGTSPSIATPTITGSFTATGLVTLADLATQAANTVLANATGSSASPTAFAMPGCSSTSSALQWTSGAGFACNSSINAATLGGTSAASYALLASPAFTGTPTAPTAAQGTNSTQIATTAFASALVAAHAPCLSILDNGGDNSFTNDNTAAWNATLALGIGANRCIYFPPGKYKFNSAVSYTIPAGIASVTVLGAGPNVSILAWPASSNGITINYAGTTSSAHIQQLSLTTGVANSGTALNLNQAASVSNQSNSAQSDVTNVTIRGDDGYQATDYWNSAITSSVSNVNFTNDHFVNPIGNGNQVVLGGTSTQVPVIFNFSNCYFEGGNASLTYGNYVQGVQVNNSNFVSGNYGIISNASLSGLDQLTVTGSQFENNTADISLSTAIPNTVIVGNLFYVANSITGVNLAATDKFSVVGNMFTISGAGTASIGVNIGATSTRGGEITGNNFDRMGTVGIQINSGTQNVTTNDNVFNGNGQNISNGTSANTILDYTPVTAVFGATSLTSATAANVGSVSLYPGMWNCYSQTQFSSSANNLSNVQTGISTTSATLPGLPAAISLTSGIMGGGTSLEDNRRVTASSNPTTVYLVAQSGFAAGTSTAQGQLTCVPSR